MPEQYYRGLRAEPRRLLDDHRCGTSIDDHGLDDDVRQRLAARERRDALARRRRGRRDRLRRGLARGRGRGGPVRVQQHEASGTEGREHAQRGVRGVSRVGGEVGGHEHGRMITDMEHHEHARIGSVAPRRRAARAARRALLLGVAAASLAAGAPGAAGADQGAKLYATLCASCHGVAGHGDGPAAGALVPPPTDLTKSTLVVAELMRVIDGRRTVRAHGSDTMPVWGHVFEKALEGSGREHRDSLRQVQILAEYVARLERK